MFSLIMSVLAGMTEIGVGANVGAGVFITTFVAGCVAVCSNCKVNKRAFLRDCSFYTLCIIYLIFVFFDKQIKLLEAIGFLLLYGVYITVGRTATLSPRWSCARRRSPRRRSGRPRT